MHPRFLHPKSVTGRLTLASLFVLPLILGLTAIILERSFNQSLKTSYLQQLELQTYVLMGAAEAGGGELWMPPVLQEPRFTQPQSGLFGTIRTPDGDVLWVSPSTLGTELPTPPDLLENPDKQQGTLENNWFYFTFKVIWQTEDGKETPFIFTVFETPRHYLQELRVYRWNLWIGLGLLAIFLLGAQLVILRWGLSPLGQVAKDLSEIEKGNADSLKGDYPNELAAITENLNLLLVNERRQRQRYHDTLADLAHSLKTPLAVLRNHAHEKHDNELSEPVERMNQIISHQLSRASQQSVQQLLKPVSAHHCLARINNALSKVYRDKNPNFAIKGVDIAFKGDERDLMEVFGNLLDNALKYGNGRVCITTKALANTGHILIEDDGDGIPQENRKDILSRGTRADSIQPGQGIGLSVVIDILNVYQGSLTITESQFGGAAFEVVLPL